MRLFALTTLIAITTACGAAGDDTNDDDATGSDNDTDVAEVDTDAADDEGDSDTDTTDDGGDGPVAVTGLQGSCEAYKDCGGTYYPTAQDCVDATLDYWGDCAGVRTALDAFGDCMMTLSCDDYNPDSYNPANTDCAEEWNDVRDSEC